MGSYRIMRLCLAALLWALFPAIAAAQQVPNPINAPASITSGHAYCATSNPQQSADCGTAPSGGAPIPCVTGNNYPCLDTTNTFTVGPQIFRANGVEVGTPTGGDQGAGTVNVDTGFFINGVPLSVGGSSGGANLNQGPLLEVLPNDSGTGTNAGKFAKLNSSGNVRTLTTADTTDGIGICFALTGFTCGTSGNAAIAIGGQVPCFFDGGTTANDWVVASTTTAGDCHDAGSTVPTSVSVLGVALTTNVGAGLYAVDLDPIGLTNAITKRGGGGGGGAPATCALAGNYACTNLPASWSAGQRSTPVAVTLSTSTFTPDMNTSDNFTFALVHASCPCQIANPSNLTAGQTGVFVITQSATGGDTVTWGGNYAFPNGTPTLQTTASAEDYFSFYAESSSRIVVVPASGAYGAVQQVVNYNTAAPPTFPSETGFAVNGANSTGVRNAASAFAASAFHTAMRADGTGAAPSAVQSGEEIGGTNGYGYNGSAYVGPIFSFRGYAAENLAVGHQGSKACISTTPIASTTLADILCVTNDGQVQINGGSNIAHGELINVQRITATGAYTYTPTSGTNSVVIELQGAGGGGGAVSSPGGSSVELPAGGGGGCWIRVRLTANFSGGTGSVGAHGAGGSAGLNPGANGGNTTFVTTAGSPVTYTAGGGAGGAAFAAGGSPNVGGGAAGGTCTNGDDQQPGGASSFTTSMSTAFNIGSSGGLSRYSNGTTQSFAGAGTSSAGITGSGKGGGGSGAVAEGGGGAKAGGDGTDGEVIIWEYNFLLQRDLSAPVNDNFVAFMDEVV